MEQATFTAPNKVCPHCGAMSQTTEKKCPNCGKGYKKRTVLKVIVGLAVLGLVAMVGCAALIGSAAEEVGNELDAQQNEHAITTKQFKSLDLGTSQSAVIKELGVKPEDKQEFENEGFMSEEPSSSSCIYYNKKNGEFGDIFQLCFDEKKLSSKNAY
jgi:hypothetical protein